jgi:hypothetical protein
MKGRVVVRNEGHLRKGHAWLLSMSSRRLWAISLGPSHRPQGNYLWKNGATEYQITHTCRRREIPVSERTCFLLPRAGGGFPILEMSIVEVIIKEDEAMKVVGRRRKIIAEG